MCPKGYRVAWDLLKILATKNMSAQELAQQFNLPSGTARGEISYLKKQCLIERVPQEKRGIPFRLTAAGIKRLQQLKEEPT
jgi:DNA-binding IclR family transcriptional regulator